MDTECPSFPVARLVISQLCYREKGAKESSKLMGKGNLVCFSLCTCPGAAAACVNRSFRIVIRSLLDHNPHSSRPRLVGSGKISC